MGHFGFAVSNANPLLEEKLNQNNPPKYFTKIKKKKKMKIDVHFLALIGFH